MIKRLIYFLLFAGAAAVMFFLTAIEAGASEITGINIIEGAFDNIGGIMFRMIAFGIVILPVFTAALSALFSKPKHIGNMVTFISSAVLFFVMWPALYQIGLRLDVLNVLGQLDKFGEVFSNLEFFGEVFKAGLGAIIAAGICAAGAVIALILKLTEKETKKKKKKA